MYHFNLFLFKRLPSMFGMTQHELSDLCLGAKHKFARRVANQDVFPFKELIDVCNTLRISLADFITLNPNEPFLESRFRYVIPEDKFQPIIFQPQNIRFVYGPNGLGGNITREDVAKAMGVSLTTITRWSNPEMCSLSVTEMLRLCNHYRINLGTFVEDKNKPIQQIEKEDDEPRLSPRIWQELSELKQLVEKDREEISALKQENSQLRTTLKAGNILSESHAEGWRAESGRNIRKWKVNWTLLENLTSVLAITRKELIQSAGLANFNCSFYDGDLTVESLVMLCNHWHISTRHFFLRDNGIPPVVYQYDYYRSDDWKTVTFHPEHVNDLFGKDGLTEYRRSEIAELNGVSEASIRNWRQAKSTMRLSDLVRLCNTLDVSPSCFITDRNRTELSYSLTYAEFLLEENRLLRQRILRLNEKVRSLKGEKERLSDE